MKLYSDVYENPTDTVTAALTIWIADELYLSHHTMKTHMQNIFRKTGCGSRTEVLHKAMPLD